MREEFDLLIVGAGPAGSFAAERLARGGARVALFDGRPAGEPKACGGGVTSKALKAWPHLAEAAGRTVDEVEMFSPAGARVRLKLAQPFAIYSRTALDSHLRERARAAGAKVFTGRVSVQFDKKDGEPWRVRARGDKSTSGDASESVRDSEIVRGGVSNGESARGDEGDGGSVRGGVREWRGRVLVAADGANSPVARRLAGPLPNSEMEVAFGYRAPLPKGEDAPTVIAFLPGWIGYAWAFPRLDHVSFGIATTQDAFEHRPLDALLWDFMLGYYAQREDPRAPLWSSGEKRDGAASERGGGKDDESRGGDGIEEIHVVAGDELRASVERRLRVSVERYAARIPGLAPETFDTRRVGGDDWALLGDAAGFADPVTGEGIYYALRSAELFAGCYLAGRVSDYERRWRADFGRELQRASRMRRRFYGQFLGAPFTSRMIEFARLHPGIRRTLRELVAGDQGYVTLKRSLARRALWPR